MRQLLLKVGATLVVLGAIVLLFGLSGLMQRIPCPNVPNGCPDYTTYWDEVYTGTGVIVLGVAIMIVSRFLRRE